MNDIGKTLGLALKAKAEQRERWAAEAAIEAARRRLAYGDLVRMAYTGRRVPGFPWLVWNYTARPNELLGKFADRDAAEAFIRKLDVERERKEGRI
jgi:hypothetical protein